MVGAKNYPEGFRSLLARLTQFKVLNWSSSSEDRDTDRVKAVGDDAHVVSSLMIHPDTEGRPRHKVVLDIDHPTYLVRSTPPGHFHLYIDVPGGIEWDKYKALLLSLASAGVIENGYAGASLSRGHSDVRLPWIKKGQET